MSLQNRVGKIEEAILIMKDLLVRQDARLENYFKALEESRGDFEFKINALVDSQIRNETEISELKETSKSTLQRIERLENH